MGSCCQGQVIQPETVTETFKVLQFQSINNGQESEFSKSLGREASFYFNESVGKFTLQGLDNVEENSCLGTPSFRNKGF
ncbi:hypothetical protein pb186bvf_001251 [Paramecium bursaria]